MTHHTPAELERIPAPTAAQHVGQWVDQDGDGVDWGRYVRGTRLNISGVAVTMCGWQDGTGAVDWHASMAAADNELDAAALRRVAALVLDAADELTWLRNQSS